MFCGRFVSNTNSWFIDEKNGAEFVGGLKPTVKQRSFAYRIKG